MLSWLEEYQSTGEMRTDFGETDSPEEAEDKNSETNADISLISAGDIEVFNHRSPTIENDAPELLTEENVKTEIQVIIATFSGLIEQSPFNCDQVIEIVNDQLSRLAIVRQRLIDIRDRAQRNQDKEAT